MSRFTFVFIFILIFTIQIFAQNETIAVLDFSNNCLMEKEKYQALSGGLAEIMITELSKVKSLQLVERQKINELINEMQLAQSGLISEDTGVQVGKLLGAKYLVFGSYMIFDKKIRVDVRIVEVETGLTIKAEEVTDKVKNMFKVMKKLSEKILKNLNVKLSKEDKKNLFASETSTEVIELFSKGLEAEEKGDLENAKIYYVKAFKMDNHFSPVRKKLKNLLMKEKKK